MKFSTYILNKNDKLIVLFCMGNDSIKKIKCDVLLIFTLQYVKSQKIFIMKWSEYIFHFFFQ